MYKELKVKLTNTLKAEFDYVRVHEDSSNNRLDKMNDIYHIGQIIEHFDELEPIIANYLNKKAREEKFER